MIARRQLLTMGGAVVLGGILDIRPGTTQVLPSPLVVTLTDIDLASDGSLADDVLDVFLAHRIPIVLALALKANASDKISVRGIEFLRRISLYDAQLCEVGLHVVTTQNTSRYKALRTVSDAQTEFRLYAERAVPGGSLQQPKTLVSEGLALFGGISSPLRAAGIRSIIDVGFGNLSNIRTEPSVDQTYSMSQNGVAYLTEQIDAHSTFVDAAFNPLQQVKMDMLRQAGFRNPMALRLSIDGLTGIERRVAITYVDQLTELIDDTVRAGQVRCLTAITLFVQSYNGPLCYRIASRQNAERKNGESAAGYIVAKGIGIEDFVLKAVSRTKTYANQSLESATAAMILPDKLAGPPVLGLDRFGRLHIAWNQDCRASLTDCVVDLPEAGSELHERLAQNTMARLEAPGCSAFLSADEYYRAVIGSLPVLEYIQQARAMSPIHVSRSKLPPAETALYQADAQTAWRYFERFAQRLNNLAPATMWIDSDSGDYYPILTMWDVGSLILAAVSARRIGIIEDDQLTIIAQSIVRFLTSAAFVTGRSRLPPVNWSVTKAPGDRVGFDATDVGRLLVALKTLDQQTDGALKLNGLVALWDLNAALDGGHLHDHNGREWISTQRQLYSIYARRGYQLWGFEIAELFDDDRPASTMDRAVAFVENAASRGPFATEPFVTDAIELGASEHSRLIADVMFGAQFKRFSTTGILTAASEGPIDIFPWFTYQGFEIRDNGESWTVHVPLGHSELQTAAFENANRLQNTKASYLWAAARPHEYHDRLVQNIRANATTQVGFASGVRELTGIRSKVADINSNGIVLESIAYLLGKQKPLCCQ